jgi:hypothetical protein
MLAVFTKNKWEIAAIAELRERIFDTLCHFAVIRERQSFLFRTWH